MLEHEKEPPPAGGPGAHAAQEDRRGTDSATIPEAGDAPKRKRLSPDPLFIGIALMLFHGKGPYPLSVVGEGPARGENFADIERAVEWAVGQNRSGRNVYVCVAKLRTGWDGVKASKEDVASVRRLWVDVDPRAGEPLAAERERIARLMSAGLPDGVPEPSLVIDSGGGFWGFFDLADPVVIPDPMDPGWAAAVASVEDRNRALALRFGADNCHNIERICRLPGTINWPNEKKVKAGRVKALARVVDELVNTNRYDLADFDTVADPQADNRAASGRAATPVTAVPESGILIDDPRLAVLSERVRSLILRGRDEGDPDHRARYPTRSEAVFGVAASMARAGLADEVILGVLLNPDFGISMSLLEKGRSAESSARHTIGRARLKAEEPGSGGPVSGGSAAVGGGGPVLSTAPLDWARALREGRFPYLVHFRGEFLDWDGAAYAPVPDAQVRREAYTFLETCQLRAGDEPKPFQPRITSVNEAVDALKAVGHLIDTRVEPPRWLDNRPVPDPRNVLAVRNGLLDLTTGEMADPDPMFFTRNALDFDYDPDAPPPGRWLEFLREAWPGEDEAECVTTLQDFMGYLLTPNTSLQKALLIPGPKRSGKGTIGRVMTRLIGEANTVSPSLNNFGGTFSLEPLLAKQLAIVSDLRLGRSTDNAAVAETVLRITGEDRVSVNRKNKTAVEVTLPTRFVCFTNVIPQFSDASDALISRFLILPMRQSFYGKEDPNLSETLARELPGILKWAIDGWRRVRARGRIAQPEAGLAEVDLMIDLGSPVPAFVAECCDLAPGLTANKDEMFAAFQSWHKRSQGTDYLSAKNKWCSALYAATDGAVSSKKMRGGGGRDPSFAGICLRRGWNDPPF